MFLHDVLVAVAVVFAKAAYYLGSRKPHIQLASDAKNGQKSGCEGD